MAKSSGGVPKRAEAVNARLGRLWAPWRTEYIKAFPEQKQARCFICAARRARNRKKHFVLEKSPKAIVLMNLYPYNPGHLLVAPTLHVADLSALTSTALTELMLLSKKWVGILGKTMHPDGFNLGINIGESAGAGLPEHVHIHIVPRWTGDTSFMSVVSGTKVVSMSMQSVYSLLSSTAEL